MTKQNKIIIGGIAATLLLFFSPLKSANMLANTLYKNWKGVKEDDQKFYSTLLSFWTNLGYSNEKAIRYITGGIPWSAAFISFVMTKGGYSTFPKSASHTCFASKIKTGNYKGFELKRVSEYKPKIGDIVIRNRGGRKLTFDSFRCGDYSHSDIVVSKEKGKLFLIGGNLSNSIKKTYVRLGRNGEITDSRYFAIVKVD